MSLSQQEIDLHLFIKDIYSTHDPLLHITTVADRAELVRALIAAGYRKAPAPVIEWGVATKWGQRAEGTREQALDQMKRHRASHEDAKLVQRVAAAAPGPWEWVAA